MRGVVVSYLIRLENCTIEMPAGNTKDQAVNAALDPLLDRGVQIAKKTLTGGKSGRNQTTVVLAKDIDSHEQHKDVRVEYWFDESDGKWLAKRGTSGS